MRADRRASPSPGTVTWRVSPGRLAQLVEHLHDAQEVRRSSRLPPTTAVTPVTPDRTTLIGSGPRFGGDDAFRPRPGFRGICRLPSADDRRIAELDGCAVP